MAGTVTRFCPLAGFCLFFFFFSEDSRCVGRNTGEEILLGLTQRASMWHSREEHAKYPVWVERACNCSVPRTHMFGAVIGSARGGSRRQPRRMRGGALLRPGRIPEHPWSQPRPRDFDHHHGSLGSLVWGTQRAAAEGLGARRGRQPRWVGARPQGPRFNSITSVKAHLQPRSRPEAIRVRTPT